MAKAIYDVQLLPDRFYGDRQGCCVLPRPAPVGSCAAPRRCQPQGFFRLKGGYKTIRKAAIALATVTHTSADFYLNLPVRELVEIHGEVAEEWQKIKN